VSRSDARRSRSSAPRAPGTRVAVLSGGALPRATRLGSCMPPGREASQHRAHSRSSLPGEATTRGQNWRREPTALGLPAILAPLPVARGVEQTANARVLADASASVLLPEAELTAEGLVVVLPRNTPSRRRASSLSPHRPVSSEPYLRRLSGMMVISGDVAINGRASGSSWSRRAYPPWTKRPDAFGSR
jgi:Glycosyltransferase family 28 C-terminal domain